MSSLVTKPAPDFTAQAVMPDNSFAELTLSSYQGKYVVLFFYPLDFTFVCPSEIIAFDKAVAKFKAKNTEVIGCFGRLALHAPGMEGTRRGTRAASARSSIRWSPTWTRRFPRSTACCSMRALPSAGCS